MVQSALLEILPIYLGQHLSSSRLFGIKCAKCNTGFCSSDLVMRARDNVYHMECFRCSVCSRHLLPGDEFSLRDEELLCRADHGLLMERSSAGSPISPGNIHSSRSVHMTGQYNNYNNNNNNNSNNNINKNNNKKKNFLFKNSIVGYVQAYI